MINLLIGAPGAGKSYEAVVYHVLPSLQKGRKVITNLPLNIDHFETVEPGSASLIKLVSDNGAQRAFSRRSDYGDEWRDTKTNQGPMYVIDECQRVLPRGGVDQKIIEWFELHRHEGADVVLITQSYGKIHRTIVDLCQVVWRCRKNVALGSSKTYVRKTLDGVRGAEIATTIRRYHAQYFPLYKSHTAGSAVSEAESGQVRPIWYHWSFVGTALFLCVAVWMVFQGWLNPFPSSVAQNSVVQTQVKQPVVQAQPISFKQENPEVSKEEVKPQVKETEIKEVVVNHPFSKLRLHIAGVIFTENKYLAIIRASQNGQVVFNMSNFDLENAGYTVTRLTDCSMFLIYGDYQEWLTCDAPSVGVATLPQEEG